MGTAQNVQCVNVSEADDDPSLVVTGRARLFGICPGSSTDLSMQGIINVRLRDGSATGDIKLDIAASNGSGAALGSGFYNSAPFVDLPAMGILFPSGIWFEVNKVDATGATDDLFSASLIVQGGEDTSA